MAYEYDWEDDIDVNEILDWANAKLPEGCVAVALAVENTQEGEGALMKRRESHYTPGSPAEVNVWLDVHGDAEEHFSEARARLRWTVENAYGV